MAPPGNEDPAWWDNGDDEPSEPSDAELAQWYADHEALDNRGVRPALDDPTDTPLEERASDLFHRWTMGDLLKADRTFHWTVRGLLVHPTYGMFGGEQKTLKSYVSTFLDLAVATGERLFGHFKIDRPGPVVTYVGEGGRIPYTRRLERIAAAMGITLGDAALHPTFDIAPAGSPVFTESLQRDLKDLEPALVHIDPWYAYHGGQVEAKNLLAEGAHLAQLATPCIDAGSSLIINHHFNQTGGGKGIGRLSMAGAQEWVDSWVLLGHRDPPDVPNGRFHLAIEIGSRQWGGAQWDLDLDIGRFDEDTTEYDGTITWDLNRTNATRSDHDKAKARILAAVMDAPGELSKEDTAKAAGVSLDKARTLVDDLTREGHIERRHTTVPIKGGERKMWRYFTTPQAEPEDI